MKKKIFQYFISILLLLSISFGSSFAWTGLFASASDILTNTKWNEMITELNTKLEVGNIIAGTGISVTATGSDVTLNSTGGGGVTIPYISTTEIDEISTSTTQSFTIEGSGFTPSSSVSMPGFPGTINSVNVISSTEISIDITTTATVGTYDIVVDNSGSLNTLWTGNGAGLVEVVSFTILTPGTGATPWTSITGAVTTGVGVIAPTTTATGWNRGAGFGTVPASTDFTLEFQPDNSFNGSFASGYAMFGVDNSNPDANYTTIDYAIYLQNGSNLMVYENGTSKGTFGTFTGTDILQVKRTGTTITYIQNGSVFYTSTVPSSSSVVFDSSIYRYIGAKNITMYY